MKLLVIGCKGQLGTDMMSIFTKAGHEVVGVDFPQIDITNLDTTRKLIYQYSPEVVINPAAFTAVDDCEVKQDIAFKVNAEGAGNVALCAKEIGASVVHISTDYVFDGRKQGSYVESDTPDPQTVYGKSKYEGEKLVQRNSDSHFIIRIAWLYGLYGNNFVKTIANAARKKEGTGDALSVVNDQHGSPTWTVDVCNQILKLIPTKHFGLYHATSEGECTWYDFAAAIVKAYGINTPVKPCLTKDYPRPAPRPANSVLENEKLKKLGLNIMPHWEKAFQNFLEEEEKLMK